MKAVMRAVNASENDGKLYDPTGDMRLLSRSRTISPSCRGLILVEYAPDIVDIRLLAALDWIGLPYPL
jgi:hypothetical protein